MVCEEIAFYVVCHVFLKQREKFRGARRRVRNESHPANPHPQVGSIVRNYVVRGVVFQT
jgi:hypothetical protein